MSSDHFRRRVLVLPLAALIILALVVYRINRGERPSPPVPKSAGRSVRQAPQTGILLADQHKHTVKLERYYGRAPLVLVFFDRDAGADRDPYLLRLRECYDRLEAAGIQPIGISTATRFENLQAEERAGTFPFPLLSDILADPPIAAPLHRQFGLYDAATGTTRTAVFLIDRAGRMPWQADHPRPVSDPESAIDSLCRGQWPHDREA